MIKYKDSFSTRKNSNLVNEKKHKILSFVKLTFILITIYSMVLISSTFLQEYRFINTYGKSTATSDSLKIGEVSLYSSPVATPSLSRITGHSWIYVKNTTSEPFKIFDYEVKPQEGISFGTTGHPKMSATGIWVNLEGYNRNYSDNISITTDFYFEDLEYLETYLTHHNKWTLLYNCTTFACQLWNNLSSGDYYTVHSITPKGLYRDLDNYLDSEGNVLSTQNKIYVINDGYSPLLN